MYFQIINLLNISDLQGTKIPSFNPFETSDISTSSHKVVFSVQQFN